MNASGTSPIDICARCGEACNRGDLVCNRCSETRVRAALPDPVESGETMSERFPSRARFRAARKSEEGSLDEHLSRIEESTGEKAHHVVASVEGALGGEVVVSIAIVTTPEGPATPPEDVWSEPVALTTLECGSSEVAAARMHWIDRVTAERGLLQPEIRRRFRVGTPGYRGEPEAVGMLLDARLHMARRALDVGDDGRERACAVEEDGDTFGVVADFTNKGAIQIFSETGASPELRSAIHAWVAAHAAAR